MADLTTDKFLWPSPNPDDPLGGVAGTVDALAEAIEDEAEYWHRELLWSDFTVDSATTTTTEISIANATVFASQVITGDILEIDAWTNIGASVANDHAYVRLRDDTGVAALAGPILNYARQQLPSAVATAALPYRLTARRTVANGAVDQVFRLGLVRASGTGNVFRSANTDRPTVIHITRLRRATP